MSEEDTRNLPDGRPFEERVFARFDAMDARFDAVDASLRDLNGRVERLESESERRNAETKPIWERALAEIASVNQKVDALSEKFDAFDRKVKLLVNDMLTLRADQTKLGDRMDKLEVKPAT